MIWVIAGTSEASRISELYPNHFKIIYSTATAEALEFIKSKNTFVGRMDKGEMIRFINNHRIRVVFDLSHPFADIVSENAKMAAEKMGISYFRFLRETNENYRQAIYVSSYEEACKKISELKGTFLFTTGSKKVKEFENIKGKNRFIFRVLPSSQSMTELRNAGVQMKDSIGMLGPFSVDMNRIILKENKVDYLVTKESGKRGGLDEKVNACILEDVTPIIISRSKEKGIKSYKELINMIEEYF